MILACKMFLCLLLFNCSQTNNPFLQAASTKITLGSLASPELLLNGCKDPLQ